MSQLKQKSEFNKLAAEKLIVEHLHAPSVHCSYYHCVQLMLHIIHHKLSEDPKQFALDAKNNKKGTHGHAIYYLELAMAQQVVTDPKARGDYKQFQKDIQDLKFLREKADYQDKEIIGKDSGLAIALATSTNNILNRRF